MSADTETYRIKACASCRHYLGSGWCSAFPDGDGIPEAILLGEIDHREPIDGDGGIRYEPIEQVSAA